MKDQIREGVFTEKTLVPVGLVITAISGIFWVSSLYYKVEATAKGLDNLYKDVATYNRAITKVDRRLYRMETVMKIKNREPAEDEDGE